MRPSDVEVESEIYELSMVPGGGGRCCGQKRADVKSASEGLPLLQKERLDTPSIPWIYRLMETPAVAPSFKSTSKSVLPSHSVPSSSPAFDTLVHPIRQATRVAESPSPSILPIILPPATLRPLAFRTITKKHNLTLTSSALQLCANFIGKQCGSGWREEGLAERVLDEAAKLWKKMVGTLIVNGDGEELKSVLRNIEGSMSGGRVRQPSGLSRKASFTFGRQEATSDLEAIIDKPGALKRHDSLGLSTLDVDDSEGNSGPKDPRQWLKVIGAFDQPRLTYNVGQKHFEPVSTPPSLLPDPSHKTKFFRHRYNVIHQRLLRNESFQTSTMANALMSSLQRSASTLPTAQQAYKLTPIANLLGRSGSSHILLGLLMISPTGLLTLTDLTGSILLDTQHARPAPEDGAWFTPGMIALVDGMYEEEAATLGQGLDGNVGVGGTVGGKFIAFSIGGPPCERRDITLGIKIDGTGGSVSAGGGFGWVDFLGVGSDRAAGSAMRDLERNVLKRGMADASGEGRGKMVILGEVNLDSTETLQVLSKVLSLYAAEPADQTPMVVVLMGNFARYAVMPGSGKNGSVEYKEYFDALASVLSEYPTMLQRTTFVFVPGNNDPWASSFSAGAATPLPQAAVPELFTGRVRRAFATANAEAERSPEKKMNGEVVWSTNPTRLSLFGPAQEIVLFRDDMSGRLRRNAMRFKSREQEVLADSDSTMSKAMSSATSEVSAMGDSRISRREAENVTMDVDTAVERAESQIPASRTKKTSDSALSADLHEARKLVKTILDQGHLSPFPMSDRPVLWDYAGALQLYPLPTALVLMDPEALPFTVSYQGCLVMNPGSLKKRGGTNIAQWMEYDARTRQGTAREARL